MSKSLWPKNAVGRSHRQTGQVAGHAYPACHSAMRDHEVRWRSFDLMIGRLPSIIPAYDTVVEVLSQDGLFVVAGEETRWPRPRRIDLAELINAPWTHPPLESLAGARVVDAFRAQ